MSVVLEIVVTALLVMVFVIGVGALLLIGFSLLARLLGRRPVDE